MPHVEIEKTGFQLEIRVNGDPVLETGQLILPTLQLLKISTLVDIYFCSTLPETGKCTRLLVTLQVLAG